jgi:hypothetical protein
LGCRYVIGLLGEGIAERTVVGAVVVFCILK